MTRQKICSGDILVFWTYDSEKYPHPSKELLDMQWVLNMVVAMSGAVDVPDDNFNVDNGSEEDSSGEEVYTISIA